MNEVWNCNFQEMYLLDGSVNGDKGIMSFIVVVNDGVRRVDGHEWEKAKKEREKLAIT